MRGIWILAAALALSAGPTWTEARERTERRGGERRSAESRHSARGRSHSEARSRRGSDRGRHERSRSSVRSSGTNQRSHQSARSDRRSGRDRGSVRNDRSRRSSEWRRHDSPRRDGRRDSRQVRRDGRRDSRYVGRDGRRGSRQIHRDDHRRRSSFSRPYRHGSRRHTYHRAPRYRWARHSIHIHPTFLPHYRHGYFWSAGYYYPRYYFDVDVYPERASLRLLVDPPDAEVYVDGYYAGIVDDFDGIFQRLHVTPGHHEITLRLHGFLTWSAEVYATPYGTVRIHHDMVPGYAADADIETYDPRAGPEY